MLAKISRKVFSLLSKIKFSETKEEFDSSLGRISGWKLLLPGGGCSWAKQSGGCLMCGFKNSTRRKAATPSYLKILYKLGELMVSDQKKEKLTIYNGGSFLNEKEIPQQTREYVCNKVAESEIKKLTIESRPEYVSAKRIERMVSLLNGKILEVGIGLECQDDTIRNECIHKGFSKRDYERAAYILKENGAKLLTYIFLKPLFLSERESIKEAVLSIEYAFKVGSKQVALESAFVQKNTYMENFYNNGKFKPPWLWSIIEVIQRAHSFGPIKIGGFEDEPPPIAIPKNCPLCSEKVIQLFAEYNLTGNVDLFSSLSCSCKEEWEKEQ